MKKIFSLILISCVASVAFAQKGEKSLFERVSKIEKKQEWFNLYLNMHGSFDTKFYDYREICGKSLINELRFIWDADGFIAHKIALIAGCVGLAAAIGIILSKII